MRRTPAGVLYSGSSVELSHADATSIPANTTGLLASGTDAGTARLWKTDSSGALNTIVSGTSTSSVQEPTTFIASTGAPIGSITTGLNVDFGHITVDSGGSYLVKLHRVLLVSTKTSAVTGVMCAWELRRFTAEGAINGAFTVTAMDSSTSLDSSIHIRRSSSLTGATTFGYSRNWSTEELTNTTGSPRTEFPIEVITPMVFRTSFHRPITIRPGGNLALVCTTNTTTGSFHVEFLFTQEAL